MRFRGSDDDLHGVCLLHSSVMHPFIVHFNPFPWAEPSAATGTVRWCCSFLNIYANLCKPLPHHWQRQRTSHPAHYPAPERRPIQKSNFTMIRREYVPKYTVRVPQLGNILQHRRPPTQQQPHFEVVQTACVAKAANSCFNKPRRLHDREDKWQRGRFRMSCKVMVV